MTIKINKTFINNINKDPINVLKSLSDEQIVSIIQKANQHYYNQQKPLLTDQIYDLIKEFLTANNPNHPILKNIGAVIADGRKVKLPYFMGSLDKIKNDVKVLENWKHRFPNDVIVSDKLDGNSGLLLYNHETEQTMLYTRGDGKEGQDISHLLPFLKKKLHFATKASFAVRGELIISKEDFEIVKDKGANARNMVAGLLNSKLPDLQIAKLTSFIAYELLMPILLPSEQMVYLKDVLNIPCVHYTIFRENSINVDTLSKELINRRQLSPFEIDGIVVTHNKIHERPSLGNPDYAFAFKSIITMEKAEVVVTKVEWNMSKDGIYIPVVHFTPVSLDGVIITKAHGFNGKYIKDNVIGPGAVIVIMRSGAVIPYIVETIVKASSPQFPEAPFVWSKTGVDIKADFSQEDKSATANKEIRFKNIEYFFDKLNFNGLSGGLLKKMFDKGFDNVGKILYITKNDLMMIDGFKETLAEKIHKSLSEKINSLEAYEIMDASNMLGRGIGYKKIKLICDTYPNIIHERYMPSVFELTNIKGIETKTAELFINNLPKFFKFIDENQIPFAVKKPLNSEKATFKNDKVNGRSFVFTGARDKELEKYIIENGGIISSSVSKNTSIVVVKTLDSDSSKATKARDLNIPLMTMVEFKEYIGSY